MYGRDSAGVAGAGGRCGWQPTPGRRSSENRDKFHHSDFRLVKTRVKRKSAKATSIEQYFYEVDVLGVGADHTPGCSL